MKQQAGEHDVPGSPTDTAGTSRIVTILGYGVVVIFVALCSYYIHTHRSDFAFVATVSLPEIVAAGILILLSMLISAGQLGLFLRNFGLKPGMFELSAVTMGISLANFLVPMRGGSGGLAVYLKRVHGLDYSAFAAIYAGTGILAILVNSGLAIVGLVYLWIVYDFFHPGLSLVVAAMFAFCLYLSVFPPPVRWKSRGLPAMIFEAGRSWHLLTRDRGLLAALTGTFLAIALVLAAAFYMIYRSLGDPLSIPAVLVVSCLGNIANVVPFTPGSLGIFDAVVIQVPQLFGLDQPRSIAATLVFRVLWFCWGLGLGIPGMWYMFRRAREPQ